MRVLSLVPVVSALAIGVLALIGRWSEVRAERPPVVAWLQGDFMPDIARRANRLGLAWLRAEELHHQRLLHMQPWLRPDETTRSPRDPCE